MTLLILGLILFLGAHSVRIFAEGFRIRAIARLGENGWKGAYSVVSLIGFLLIIWGYGEARAVLPELWAPPVWTRHLASLLTLPAFILLAAAYVPATRIKAAVGHPMVLSVKLWALAHLLANGRASDVALFGAFLLWAILDYRAARARDRAEGKAPVTGTTARDLTAVLVGTAAWAAFAFVLHGWLIGVKPFG